LAQFDVWMEELVSVAANLGLEQIFRAGELSLLVRKIANGQVGGNSYRGWFRSPVAKG